jgi:hypothetical protein
VTQKNQAVRDLLEVQGELVPLRVAASIAYFHITDPVRQVSSRDDLDEILHLVAIALSTAAPIQRLDGSVLTDADLNRTFYRTLEQPGGKPDLEAFTIRRQDLKRAMTTLKEARVAFSKT